MEVSSKRLYMALYEEKNQWVTSFLVCPYTYTVICVNTEHQITLLKSHEGRGHRSFSRINTKCPGPQPQFHGLINAVLIGLLQFFVCVLIFSISHLCFLVFFYFLFSYDLAKFSASKNKIIMHLVFACRKHVLVWLKGVRENTSFEQTQLQLSTGDGISEDGFQNLVLTGPRVRFTLHHFHSLRSLMDMKWTSH